MASPRALRSRKARRTGKGLGNRPEARAGRETGKGLGPSRDPETGFFDEASALEKGSGRVARPSGGAAIRKGISPGLRLREFLERRQASARRFSKGRPEGLRPRCEPWRRRGFGRVGSARDVQAGFRSRRSDPTGIGEGLNRPSRDPPDAERGFAASLRGPRKAKRAFAPASQSESRPARDGLATQRRQSRLGQVGAGGDTGPHYLFGGVASRPRRIAGLSRAAGPILF
jgi:hypothetical protein